MSRRKVEPATIHGRAAIMAWLDGEIAAEKLPKLPKAPPSHIEILAQVDAATWPDRKWPPLCRLHVRDTGKFLGYGRDVKAVAEQRLAEEGFYGVTFRISFEGRYERQIESEVPWPAKAVES